jgi:hypothetical protein
MARRRCRSVSRVARSRYNLALTVLSGVAGNDKKSDVFYEPIQADVPRYDLTNKFWQAAGC